MTLELAAEPVPLYWAEDHRVIRIEGTRVPIDCIVYLFVEEKRTAEQIAEEYPTVGLEKTCAVISYYLRHRADVDAYVAERRRWGDELRAIAESSPDPRTAASRVVAHSKSRRAGR